MTVLGMIYPHFLPPNVFRRVVGIEQALRSQQRRFDLNEAPLCVFFEQGVFQRMAEMIRHHPSPEVLSDYARGALPDGLKLVVSCHLHSCDVCRREVAVWENAGGVLLLALVFFVGFAFAFRFLVAME